MNLLQIDPLLIVIIMQPFLIILLTSVFYFFPEYSIRKDISLAATSINPSKRLFQAVFVLYGLMIFLLATQVFMLFDARSISNIFLLIYLVTGSLTILVGLYPKDTHQKMHDIAAYGAFSMLSIVYLVSLIAFYTIGADILVLIASFNLIILFLMGWRALIRKTFDETTWMYEWLNLYLSMIFVFISAIILFAY